MTIRNSSAEDRQQALIDSSEASSPEVQQTSEDRERLVAELKHANERQSDGLRQSEERFRLLVESVQDYAIFMLDPDGIVTTWNAGAQRSKGYIADEIVGQHFSVFYTQDDIARRHPWQELETAERVGRYEEEGWRVRKDGTRFWASVVITAMRDESGELIGFAKVTRDVTERRLTEQERARAEALEQQRRFLKDILSSVTHGKLALCDSVDELPVRLALEPIGEPIRLSPRALKTLRNRVGEVENHCEFPPERAQDFTTAVSECAMNSVVHAGGGTAKVYSDAASGKVQVWITDAGKGIDLQNLPRATLEAGFSTGGGGIGHGFSLMLACCQRVSLLTGTEGTTIVLEQERASFRPSWLETIRA